MSGHISRSENTGGGIGVQWESIPSRLREKDQWVVMKDKKPVLPSEGWGSLENQLTGSRAISVAEKIDGEPAFVVRTDGEFVVLDLDKVGAPDDLPQSLKDLIDEVGGYWERSRSGTGLHGVFTADQEVKSVLETRLSRTGFDFSSDFGDPGIEVFGPGAKQQCVLLTGATVGENNQIKSGSTVAAHLETHLPESTDGSRTNVQDQLSQSDHSEDNTGSMDSPESGLRTIEEYAEKGNKYARRVLDNLRSPPNSANGYGSPSERDFAIVSDLAFWCQEDRSLIADIVRQSNSYRPKLDSQAFGEEGKTLMETNIDNAIASNHQTYGEG